MFVEDKRDLAGWGQERIADGLRERGIDRHLVERICDEGHSEQVERAVALLVERHGSLDEDRARERALGFLTRRGYGYEVAHDAIRRVGGTDQGDLEAA